MTHPRVYPHITDDYCPPAEEFNCSASMTDANYFLLVNDGEGVFFLHPHSHILYEVHTCLTPKCWGKVEAAKKGAEWMFTHTDCEKIITWVPEYNEIARRYALKAGMKEEGFSPNSYMKHGKLQGMRLLGMDKCQQQFL